MGWTSYHAEHYKKGQVDRIAEIKKICTSDSKENGSWFPLKVIAVGSTVYAAVERKRPTGEHFVYAEVFLTSVNSKDYYNFSYKNMDETCGPYETDCPASILNLLSPTDNEFAKEWREKCRQNLADKKAKKEDPNALNNLPIGSVIKMPHWDGDTRTLVKREYHSPKTIWADNRYRYTTKTIEQQGYTVVRRGWKGE